MNSHAGEKLVETSEAERVVYDLTMQDLYKTPEVEKAEIFILKHLTII